MDSDELSCAGSVGLLAAGGPVRWDSAGIGATLSGPEVGVNDCGAPDGPLTDCGGPPGPATGFGGPDGPWEIFAF